MKRYRRAVQGRLASLVAAILIVVGGCVAPEPSRPATLYPSESPQPSASTDTSQGPPQPTPLDPDDLPEASLEIEMATAICDPEQSDLDINAGESLVPCYDGLVVGLRALKTSIEDIERLYLQRPRCASTPCTTEELSTVTVTGWSDGVATSVVIDWEQNRIRPPVTDLEAEWPRPSSTLAPPVAKPEIDGAPRYVRKREPLPFCGNADEDRAAAMQCFRDAVLDNRPAEMLESFDVGGGTQVFRFAGQGLVSRYAMFGSVWREHRGGLIVGPAFGWSFEEWFAGR